MGAKDAGIIGVIHKMTEGMGGVDDKCDNRKFMADQAGLKWGLYHFMRPGDEVAQADHFIMEATKAGVLTPTTLLACDFEVDGMSLKEVLAFLQRVELQSGIRPVLYSGHTLKELGGAQALPDLGEYRLWLSQYGPTAKLPAGFDKYWLWQYSDKGNVPGVGPCDVNYFEGDDLEW